jgi:hypothetical protein
MGGDYTLGSTGSTLEAPLRFPALLSSPCYQGENPISIGMGDEYTLGIVSFLEAPLWVKGTAMCSSKFEGWHWLYPLWRAFFASPARVSYLVCTAPLMHQMLGSDTLSSHFWWWCYPGCSLWSCLFSAHGIDVFDFYSCSRLSDFD